MSSTAGLADATSPVAARSGRRQDWINAGLTLALVLSSLYVYAMWLIDTRPLMNLNSYEKAKFVDMVYGRAHKPFVYRVLVPTLVRAVRSAIPDPINYDTHGKVYARFPKLYGDMLYLGWELEYLTEYATAVLITYASLLGFGLALRALLRSLYAADAWLGALAPVLAMWVLPVFFVRGTHYLYDFPQLLLFTLLLLALARRNWWLYYPVFVLGLLNKETTILASVIFALQLRKEMPARRWLAHLGAQAALFVAIKLALWWRFRGNPGALVEDHLSINLYNALLRPYDLATLFSVAALVLLVGHAFLSKPILLRRSLLIGIPMLVLYALLGTYGEIRVFYELVPAVFLLCLQTLAGWFGWACVPRQAVILSKRADA